MLEAFLFSELLSLPDSLKFEYQNALSIEKSLWESVLYCFVNEWYAEMPEPGTVLTIYHGHTERVSAVAWSPDTTRIASGSWDKTVQVWDASTGNTLFTYHNHTGRVETVAWSPDGKSIASGSRD